MKTILQNTFRNALGLSPSLAPQSVYFEKRNLTQNLFQKQHVALLLAGITALLAITFQSVFAANEPAEKISTTSPTHEDLSLRGLVNIAPECAIQTFPYMGIASRRALTNMSTVGNAYFERGVETGGEIIFGFPQAIRVEALRFYQGSLDPNSKKKFTAFASSYLLQGRSVGSKKWDKILVRVQGTGRGGWVTHTFAEESGAPLEALRFVALEGEVGYRSAFPSIAEFEIYVKADEAVKLPSASKSTIVKSSDIPDFKPEIKRLAMEFPDATESLPNLRKQSMRGVFVEPWMFGWNTWEPSKGPLTEHPMFQKLMTNLKAMHTNTVWLYPPDARGSGLAKNTMIYPSKVTTGISKNVLTPFCEAMRAQGIRVIVMWMANMPPFSTDAWQFPLEESSRNPKGKQFENILYGNFFREKFGELMLEAMDLGADGVALLPDEYYYKGPTLPLAPDNQTDQSMVTEFKRQYGYDSTPPKIEDTRQYRAWVLLQYQGLANLVKNSCEILDKKYPNAYRTTNISVATYSHNLGMEHGLAYDLIGHTADLDGFGTDPYFDTYSDGHWMPALFTKRMVATRPFPPYRPIMVLKANQWWPTDTAMQNTFRPIWSYATPITVLAHGGGGVAYYRYNYLADDPRYVKNAEKAYSMCKFLDAEGINSSRTPPCVAILESRAGQDWWQLKMTSSSASKDIIKKDTKIVEVERVGGGGIVTTTAQSSRAQQCEKIRGQIHHKVILERLLEESIPFDQFYLDHPNDLTALKDYQLAILPFPYSIPKESAEALEKAVQNGLKLLIIRQQGESDPLGEPYPEGPLLATLIQNYPEQVQFWNDDLMAEGSLPSWSSKFKQFVEKTVGDSVQIRVEKDGDVEVVMRETDTGKRFVFLINWDVSPQVGVLKFPNAKDAYNIEEIGFSDEEPLQRRDCAVITKDILQKGIPFTLKTGELRCLLMKGDSKIEKEKNKTKSFFDLIF